MDFSHISEVDVEEGIRQEAEQRARERDEMRGMDAEDIFTPSPDEPTPPFCSSSESGIHCHSTSAARSRSFAAAPARCANGQIGLA